MFLHESLTNRQNFPLILVWCIPSLCMYRSNKVVEYTLPIVCVLLVITLRLVIWTKLADMPWGGGGYWVLDRRGIWWYSILYWNLNIEKCYHFCVSKWACVRSFLCGFSCKYLLIYCYILWSYVPPHWITNDSFGVYFLVWNELYE